ncbi:MAG: alpha-galactosidase [Prevotella sp.]|nr:alpha-galactosidase [Prevotella sp.]
MRKPLAVLLSLCLTPAWAGNYLVSTPHTSLMITADKDHAPLFQFYGAKVTNAQEVIDAGMALNRPSYPAFGLHTNGEKAIAMQQPDGNMTLDLVVDHVDETTDSEGRLLRVVMRDKIYPVEVTQVFKAYNQTDVISTWVEIKNNGRKAVRLLKYNSAFLSLPRGDNYMSHQHGAWAAENFVDEERVTNGEKVIANRNGLQNTHEDSPSLMISEDGALRETSGKVLGATLAWPGNYKLKVDAKNTSLSLIAGINEEETPYLLEGGQTFTTPELCMTYSDEGKGGVSRALHRWARQYKLHNGQTPRDILLNSWEGVYMNITEDKMKEMMKDWANIGGELFVMDDGWFGDKYPRSNSQGLGDWMVDKKKLPNGIGALIKEATADGIKFGIWIEPEMTNTKSELFEKHPDWVLRGKGRELTTGRGGTQVVLDLTNPKVQDFVFHVVDDLMTENPDIAYIKWDCNAPLMDYGSPYLPADKQSQIYIDYQLGLIKTLKRIRAKYPKLVIQDCASGGGRINYGVLPYFDEFWGSDDTDAKMRLFIQWGELNYFPAIAMGSHVSAERNHQTHRVTPIKFRMDVAMTGRLGMELQPSQMSKEDLAFAKRGIAAYKQIRDVVQLGDIYRLHSPYDGDGVASWMYASEDKSHAALFAYNFDFMKNQKIPAVQLGGLDPNRNYRIKDLTPWNEKKPCRLDGKVISGKTLMEVGLNLRPLINACDASVALELTAE